MIRKKKAAKERDDRLISKIPPAFFEYGHKIVVSLTNRDYEYLLKSLKEVDLKTRQAVVSKSRHAVVWEALLEIASLGNEILAKYLAGQERDKRDRRKRREKEIPPFLAGSILHHEHRGGIGRRRHD